MASTRNTTVKFSQNEAETILELENNWHFQLILSEEKKKCFWHKALTLNDHFAKLPNKGMLPLCDT